MAERASIYEVALQMVADGDAAGEIEKVNRKLERLKKVAEESGDQMHVSLVEKAREAASRVSELTGRLEEAKRAAEDVRIGGDSAGVSAAEDAVRGLESALDGAKSELGDAMGAWEDYVGALDNADEVMGKVAEAMKEPEDEARDLARSFLDSAEQGDLLGTASKGAQLWLVKLGMSARTAGLLVRGAFGFIGAAASFVIGLITRYIQKQREARAETQKFYDEVSERTSGITAKFIELQAAWNGVADTMEGRQQFIRDNADRFKELGIQIRDVNEAERILSENADLYIQAQIRKAQADVYRAQAQDKIKQIVDLTQKRDAGGTVKVYAGEQVTSYGSVSTYKNVDAKDYYQGQIDSLNDDLKKDFRKVLETTEEATELQRQAAGDYYGVWLDESRKSKDGGKPVKDTAKDVLEAARQASQKALDTALSSARKSAADAEVSAIEDEGARTLAALRLKHRNEIKEIEAQKKALIDIYKKEGKIEAGAETGVDLVRVAGEMKSLANGNVDVLARPLVDAAELVKKGWEDAGEGIATVFSSQFGIEDASGKVRELLVTPILPDGTVLSPEDLENYLYDVLQGADDFLKADSKGIVIAVDVDPDGTAGDKLHELQEQYYLSADAMVSKLSGVDFGSLIADTAKRQAREYRAAFEKYAIKGLPKMDNPATSGNKGLAGFGDLMETKKTLKEIAAQYSIIFADADSLSQDQLREAIRLTTEEIKNAAPGTQEYISLLERLRAQLDTQISNRGWGFSKIIDAFRNLPNAVSEYNTALDNNDEGAASKAEGEVQAYVQAVKDGMSQVSSAFSGLGSSLEKFGGKIGEIGGLLSGLASNTDNITTAFTSKNKGEIISAGISSAVQYVGMIGDQIAENKRIEEEWNATIRETAHELDMLNLEKLDYKQENLFGVENPYKRAIDGARQYGEAVGLINSKLGELAEGQVQVGTKKVSNWKNVGQGAALGAGVGAAAGSVIPAIGTAIGTAIGAAIGTVAGALGGLFGGKKKVAVYENLLDKYGSLLDESEGAGPFDLNPKIIADYKKLDDATKQIVDNWDEIKKKAEEAEEQMRQNFSDLAGDIGDQLSDALVDAFRNGDLYSAVDDFHGKMTSTIEDIVSQLVFSAVFKDLFNELEKRFNDSFKAGGDQSITDDLIWFDKIYKGNLDKYKEAMDQAKAELEGQGYDAWSSDTRTGTSKGIANASQDSVDELNGRATAIQGYTYNIQENTESLVRHSASMLEHLSGIRDNTARLEAIEKIARDIRDHGVKAL